MARIDAGRFSSIMDVLLHGMGKSFDDGQMEVWYRCLSDLNPVDLESAIVRYLMEGDDWPTIAKIRRMAVESRDGQAVDHGDAWGRLVFAVRRYGLDKIDDAREFLGDDIWRAVHGMGGWHAMCDMDEENRDFIRGQFRMCYEAAMVRASQERVLPESVLPRLVDGSTPFNVLEHYKPKGIGVIETTAKMLSDPQEIKASELLDSLSPNELDALADSAFADKKFVMDQYKRFGATCVGVRPLLIKEILKNIGDVINE